MAAYERAEQLEKQRERLHVFKIVEADARRVELPLAVEAAPADELKLETIFARSFHPLSSPIPLSVSLQFFFQSIRSAFSELPDVAPEHLEVIDGLIGIAGGKEPEPFDIAGDCIGSRVPSMERAAWRVQRGACSVVAQHGACSVAAAWRVQRGCSMVRVAWRVQRCGGAEVTAQQYACTSRGMQHVSHV